MQKDRLAKVNYHLRQAEEMLEYWRTSDDSPYFKSDADLIAAAQAHALIAQVHADMGDWPIDVEERQPAPVR